MRSEFVLLLEADGHRFEYELVGTEETPEEIYVLADGRRIAYRRDAAWVSMMPGWEVRDENGGKVEISFEETSAREMRAIPEPIMNALWRQHPDAVQGYIEGDNVYLIMADAKGRPDEVVRYIASPDFMRAVRVYDSGIENFRRLCGEEGVSLTLLAPDQAEEGEEGA